MSDFLGRLAARTSESAPAIAPRSVSRFESPSLAIQHDVVEAMSSAAPRTSSATTVDAPPAIAEPRRSSTRQDAPVVPRSQSEREVIKPADRPVPARTRIEQIMREVQTIVTAPAVADARRERVREPQVVSAPVVPRSETTPEVRQSIPARAAINQAPATKTEPTVIRVHIGRIDVRATAAATDRPRPRARPADAAMPMSLDRYLSGKDRA